MKKKSDPLGVSYASVAHVLGEMIGMEKRKEVNSLRERVQSACVRVSVLASDRILLLKTASQHKMQPPMKEYACGCERS